MEAPRVRVEARDPVAALACLEHLDLLASPAALALLDPRGNREREERGEILEVTEWLVLMDPQDHLVCKEPMEMPDVVVKLATRETRASPAAWVPWVYQDLRDPTDPTELSASQDPLARLEALGCAVPRALMDLWDKWERLDHRELEAHLVIQDLLDLKELTDPQGPLDLLVMEPASLTPARLVAT